MRKGSCMCRSLSRQLHLLHASVKGQFGCACPMFCRRLRPAPLVVHLFSRAVWLQSAWQPSWRQPHISTIALVSRQC